MAALLAACNSPTDAALPDPAEFASPIVGRPAEEVFYGAYLDQGGRDYNCGGKYYAGHRGTDILLRSFQVQDSGVTVVAAAAGQVSVVHDGEPDRNAVQNNANDWNVVYIHPASRATASGARSSPIRTPSGRWMPGCGMARSRGRRSCWSDRPFLPWSPAPAEC